MITMIFLSAPETRPDYSRLTAMQRPVCFMISANHRFWIFFHLRMESNTWQPETMQISTNCQTHTLVKAHMNLLFMTPHIFLHGAVYHGKKRCHHKQVS